MGSVCSQLVKRVVVGGGGFHRGRVRDQDDPHAMLKFQEVGHWSGKVGSLSAGTELVECPKHAFGLPTLTNH